jgi:hypothetical protein
VSAKATVALLVLLSGCAAAGPERAVEATFKGFLQAVARDDRAGIERVAPFLAALPEPQKRAALGALASLAGQRLRLRVRATEGGVYVLEAARASDGRPGLAVPFRRTAGGWQIEAILETSQIIDVVPARR